jgi:hypothetical protein
VCLWLTLLGGATENFLVPSFVDPFAVFVSDFSSQQTYLIYAVQKLSMFRAPSDPFRLYESDPYSLSRRMDWTTSCTGGGRGRTGGDSEAVVCGFTRVTCRRKG